MCVRSPLFSGKLRGINIAFAHFTAAYAANNEVFMHNGTLKALRT